MFRIMVQAYLPQFLLQFDEMDDTKIDDMIAKAKGIISFIETGEEIDA